MKLKLLANIASIIFHPLLMPMYAMLIVFKLGTYPTYVVPKYLEKMIYLIVFINTIGFPLLFVGILLRNKVIQSVKMEKKTERVLPFVFATIMFFFTYFILTKAALPQLIYSMILAASITVLISLCINFFYKISIHMVGISGLIGGFWAMAKLYEFNSVILITSLILIAGITASARLLLNAHQPSEIYSGFFVGFIIQFIVVYYAWG